MSELIGMQTWTTVPDKATRWGNGEWVNEPDKAQWVDAATGLPCLALRNDLSGVWCGYVGVHPGHPLHGVQNIGIVVGVEIFHRWVNYSASCDDDPEIPVERRICHKPQPGEPDNVWWLGFDCGCYRDIRPSSARFLSLSDYQYLQYRTLAYVQEACADLANQLTPRRKNMHQCMLGMSNYNHTIDDGLSEALKAGNVFATHSGWNFHGQVWWDGEQFVEEVWQFHKPVGTFTALSLDELMRKVNDAWGWD